MRRKSFHRSTFTALYKQFDDDHTLRSRLEAPTSGCRSSALQSFRRLRPAYCWLVRNHSESLSEGRSDSSRRLATRFPTCLPDRQARFACGNDSFLLRNATISRPGRQLFCVIIPGHIAERDSSRSDQPGGSGIGREIRPQESRAQMAEILGRKKSL